MVVHQKAMARKRFATTFSDDKTKKKMDEGKNIDPRYDKENAL